jgi:ribosomal protein S18 acetylase RimI-like enzyme
MSSTIQLLEDKGKIYTFLDQDRLYAAYAIGDLEPALFRHCEWHVSSTDGRLTSLCLSFKGLPTNRLFLMGSGAGLKHILDSAVKTSRAYFSCRPQHLSLVGQLYTLRKTQHMLRMTLAQARFEPADGLVTRLGPGQMDLLQDLYRWYGDVAFAPYQLERGVFYGVERDGRLVSTAGTHVLSRTYQLGVVGNVFTHPDYRGRGYATACASAVVEELLSQSLDIALNVEESNAPAKRIYDKLGFEVYCPFVECLGVRRAPRKALGRA